MRWMALALAALLGLVGPGAMAGTADDEIRATFDKNVAAQNAHDADAVGALLLDSPTFLWVTRGNAVWGREEAVKGFRALYAGTWRLAPDTSSFRVVLSEPDVAQIYVPIVFTIGEPGEPASETLFLMNQVLVKRGGSWKIASILPIQRPRK